MNDESALQLPLHDALYGFAAQQSCEKFLKALIAAHGVQFERTHNLERLRDVLLDLGEVLPAIPFSLKSIEPYAVQMRYELMDSLSNPDRRSMAETVAIVREYVMRRVLELQG